MRGILFAGVLISVGVVFVCVNVLFSQEQPKAAAKIGVVDLLEISQKWKKWIDLAGDVDKDAKSVEAAATEEEKKLRDAEMKLGRSPLAQDSEEWFKEKLELETLRLRAQWAVAKEKERLENKATELGRGLLAEIEMEIKKYGRENGFSLILRVEEIPLEGRSWTEMRSYVKFRQVMFYEEGINITPAIIQLLQNKK